MIINPLTALFQEQRKIHQEQHQLHLMRISRRYERLKEGKSSPTKSEKVSKHCSRCKRAFFPLLMPSKQCPICYLYKCLACFHHSQTCNNHQSLNKSICVECNNLLFPLPSRLVLWESNHSLKESYLQFHSLKIQIEQGTSPLDVCKLLVEFESARKQLSNELSNLLPQNTPLQQQLLKNFGWFCGEFWAKYRLDVQKPNEQIVGIRTGKVQTEKEAVKREIFEQQATFLRKEMRIACSKGRFEDAAAMQQSLAEIECELQRMAESID